MDYMDKFWLPLLTDVLRLSFIILDSERPSSINKMPLKVALILLSA